MKFEFNQDQNQFEATVMAKVVSLGTTELENKNGKTYVVGTIEFPNVHGELVQRGAICYTKNLEKGVEVGGTYLCNVVVTEDRPNEPLITISSLTTATRATAEDFGFDAKSEFASIGVGVEEIQ